MNVVEKDMNMNDNRYPRLRTHPPLAFNLALFRNKVLFNQLPSIGSWAIQDSPSLASNTILIETRLRGNDLLFAREDMVYGLR
jgi:hypothetical protein